MGARVSFVSTATNIVLPSPTGAETRGVVALIGEGAAVVLVIGTGVGGKETLPAVGADVTLCIGLDVGGVALEAEYTAGARVPFPPTGAVAVTGDDVGRVVFATADGFVGATTAFLSAARAVDDNGFTVGDSTVLASTS
jgi:hypothetical protein